MPYDQNCHSCPYHQQGHLREEGFRTARVSPPVELEDNGSATLLVFQAPGDVEWKVGRPIQPTKKIGGSAGVRILNSWVRKGLKRDSFDIINAVQCFTDNAGNRDFSPNTMAICCCSNRLKYIIDAKQYTRIITFGDVAFEVVSHLVQSALHRPIVKKAPHPNSGVKNDVLDALW